MAILGGACTFVRQTLEEHMEPHGHGCVTVVPGLWFLSSLEEPTSPSECCVQQF